MEDGSSRGRDSGPRLCSVDPRGLTARGAGGEGMLQYVAGRGLAPQSRLSHLFGALICISDVIQHFQEIRVLCLCSVLFYYNNKKNLFMLFDVYDHFTPDMSVET